MFGVAVPLSVAVAFLSYRAIEEPFLRLRRRWVRARPPADEPVLSEPLTPERLAEGVVTG